MALPCLLQKFKLLENALQYCKHILVIGSNTSPLTTLLHKAKCVAERGTTVFLNDSLRAKTSDNAVLFFLGEILSSQQTTIFVGHTEGTASGSNATF